MYGTYDVSKGTVTITVDEKVDHHITQTTTDEAGNTIYATNKGERPGSCRPGAFVLFVL